MYAEVATVTPDETGIFIHYIGTGSALGGTSLEPADFDYAGDVFVQVAVNTEGNVLLPRTLISGAPYATLAEKAADSDHLGGQPPNYYLDLANHTGDIGLGQMPECVGSIWLPAWIFAPDTRHSTDSGEIWSLAVLPTLVFPDGGQTKATAVVSFPDDFVPGDIRFNLVLAGDEDPTPGNDQVRWVLRARNLLQIDSADAPTAYSTIPAADEVVVTTATSLSPLESGDAVAIQIFRNALPGIGDTYEYDVNVLGVRIDYTRAPEAF